MENFKSALLFDAEGDLSQRWYVFYYYRNPETGKFQRFRDWVPLTTVTKGARYSKSKEMMIRINNRLRLGWNPFSDEDKGQINIVQAIDAALAIKKSILRKRTSGSYKSYVKFFKKYLTEKHQNRITIDSLSNDHAIDFMDWYQSTRKIGNRTYNNVLVAMHAIFSLLMKRKYLMINPFSGIEFLPEDEPGIISFDPMERRLIYNELPKFNIDLYVISQLIFGCSLRPQEIMRLQIWHLHLDHGQIEVPGNTTKNRKSRMIDIPDSILPEILKLDLNYPAHYYVFSFGLQRGEKENYPTRISDMWRIFSRMHGITKGIYGLKHTANGLALDAGIDLRDIQLHNRHHSLAQTEIYLNRFRKNTTEKFRREFPTLSDQV